MRKNKIIMIFTTAFVLFFVIVSPIFASFSISATRRIVTSSAPIDIYASKAMEEGALRPIVTRSMMGESVAAIGAPILTSLSYLSLAYVLFLGISSLVDKYKTCPGVYSESVDPTVYKDSLGNLLISVDGPRPCGYFSDTTKNVNLTVYDEYAVVNSVDTRSRESSDPLVYCTVSVMGRDGYYSNTICYGNKNIAYHVNDCRSPGVKANSPAVTIITVDQEKLAEAISSHPEYLSDKNLVNPSIEPASSVSYQSIGEVTGSLKEAPITDPTDKKETDPKTGEKVDPVESTPTGQTDKMETPGQAVVPDFNTNILTPEKKNISGRLRTFIDNAPFMALGRSIKVTSASSQSVFDVPTPFGSVGVMDFGKWDWLWSSISAIVISISYLYAAQIVFGGKV